MSGQKGRVKFFNLKEIQCGETTSMDEGAKGGGGMIEGRNDKIREIIVHSVGL